jgi:hypothetical protein
MSGEPKPPWGVIGWAKSVELGVGIATGFLVVSFIVGMVYGLILFVGWANNPR